VVHEHLTVVRGDAREEPVLREAVRGADAVISTLGPTKGSGPVLAVAVPLLLGVMEQEAVRRLVVLSGAGVTVPGDRKALPDRLVSLAMRVVARDLLADHEAALRALQSAGGRIDWTLVRAPRLGDDPPAGGLRHGERLNPGRAQVSRADLAAFLLTQVTDRAYVGRAPFVAAAP
jgi:putative NADH-flavin reductase